MPKPSHLSPKEEKLAKSFSAALQQFITGKSYTPMTSKELIDRLSIPKQHIRLFRTVLSRMVKQGVITKHGKRFGSQGDPSDVVTGTIKVHPRGFGFLTPDHPSDFSQDIFIPKHQVKSAVDGDTVEVLVNPDSTSEKGPEGKVIAVVKRGRTHLAGTIQSVSDWGEAIAYCPILGSSHTVTVDTPEDWILKVGDRLILKVTEWGGENQETRATPSHSIGHISDASVDVAAAIEEFNLRSDFPNDVVQEATSWGRRVKLSDIKERVDFRDQETFTIDPETAKDFDDALTLSKDKKGHYHLIVHIADVTHYVAPGSHLDQEAARRCNSTYFPGKCIPMLPPELSENLCSLKPNVNRLAVSVMMEFNPKGDLIHHRIVRSVIKSQKRFTYQQAKDVLDGKRPSKHKSTLLLMVELCQLLKQQRHERGSVEFALPEYVVVVDEKGVPTGVKCIEYDITHQMVEEFMLKANETVATHLTQAGKDLTYRIHETPAEDNLKDFSGMVATFGFHLPENPEPSDIQKLFNESKESPHYQHLATAYIRCMRLACYSPSNLGHYGLSLEHYTHFTSPIRRYADLLVHRILFGVDIPLPELQQASDLCSEQERLSARAESTVRLLKKLRLLKSHLESEPEKQFPAVTTKVKPFGVFFEVLEFMIESYLHVSELHNDFYLYDEAKQLLRGDYSGQLFTSGNPLTVMVKDIDLIALESKWHLVSETPSKGQSGNKRGKRRPFPSKNRPTPKAKKPRYRSRRRKT